MRKSSTPKSNPPKVTLSQLENLVSEQYGAQSQTAEARFRRCQTARAGARSRWGLDGVTRNVRMTDKEVQNLHDYMRSTMTSVTGAEGLFVYDTLKSMMDGVLCRYPRPSELAKLSKYFNISQRTYYHTKVRLVAPSGGGDAFGRLVGKNGANFNRHTQNLGFLYMWMHAVPNKPLERDLHLYSINVLNMNMQTVRSILGSSPTIQVAHPNAPLNVKLRKLESIERIYS